METLTHSNWEHCRVLDASEFGPFAYYGWAGWFYCLVCLQNLVVDCSVWLFFICIGSVFAAVTIAVFSLQVQQTCLPVTWNSCTSKFSLKCLPWVLVSVFALQIYDYESIYGLPFWELYPVPVFYNAQFIPCTVTNVWERSRCLSCRANQLHRWKTNQSSPEAGVVREKLLAVIYQWLRPICSLVTTCSL